MAVRLRELALREERLAPGHRLCAGCGEAVAIRQILSAVGCAASITSARAATPVSGCVSAAIPAALSRHSTRPELIESGTVTVSTRSESARYGWTSDHVMPVSNAEGRR